MKLNDTTLIGVRMGKGFADALLEPRPLKEYITNESRLEDGVRVLQSIPRFDKRSLTLEFQITGNTKATFAINKRAFLNILAGREVKLEVPEITTEVFHLLYTGKSVSYSSGLSGLACKIKVGFDEPNPGNRQ